VPSEFVINADSVESEEGIEMVEAAIEDLELMSVEEAIKAMEKQKREFFLFNSSETGTLSFVYRRTDGNYAVIRV
jgi:hypothetical protein